MELRDSSSEFSLCLHVSVVNRMSHAETQRSQREKRCFGFCKLEFVYYLKFVI